MLTRVAREAVDHRGQLDARNIAPFTGCGHGIKLCFIFGNVPHTFTRVVLHQNGCVIAFVQQGVVDRGLLIKVVPRRHCDVLRIAGGGNWGQHFFQVGDAVSGGLRHLEPSGAQVVGQHNAHHAGNGSDHDSAPLWHLARVDQLQGFEELGFRVRRDDPQTVEQSLPSGVRACH